MPVDRYSRQIRFPGIGAEGQERLRQSRIAIVGCGALGAAAAEQLARAGVGSIRLIDRDIIEYSNLQRQGLYSEADAAAEHPKVIAAAARLQAINSHNKYEPVVAQLDSGTVEQLLADVDLVVDGCDNFATRHVINEFCLREQLPWVYAACVGSYAMCMPIVPHLHTACLRCLQDELPDPGTTPTCDTGGIIAPAVQLAAAYQVAEVLKILCHQWDAVRLACWTCDLWSNSQQSLDSHRWRDPACLACGPNPTYPALQAAPPPMTHLCGRDGYQCHRPGLDLTALAQQLGDKLERANDYLLRWHDSQRCLTAFKDGRVLVQGVNSPGAAAALVDRWLSN